MTTKYRIYALAVLSVLVAGFTLSSATTYMFAATLTYLLMVWGFFLRINKKWHVPLMLLAIVGDLIIVISLEVQRHAIETAVSFKLNPLQQSHILFSTIATVLYFPTLYLGFVRLFGRTKKPQSLIWHQRMGILALVFRSLGFLMMFTLLK